MSVQTTGRKNVCAKLSLLLAAILLTGCGLVPSEGDPKIGQQVVTPKLRNYSTEFQARAADELETVLKQPPCQRQQTEGDLSGCSAVRVIVKDHLELRDSIRALDDKLDDQGHPQ